MSNCQEVTEGDFDMAFLKFQQDLQAVTEAQKDQDVLSNMCNEDLIREVTSLNVKITSLSETFNTVQWEKGKVDEAFASFKKALKISEEGGPEAYAIAIKIYQELNEDITQLRQENGEAEKTGDAREVRSSSLSQFSSMETALKRSQEREVELQQEVVNAEKKIATMEYNIKTTMEKLETAERSFKSSENEVVSMKEDLLVFRRKASEKEAEVLDVEKERASLKKEITELKSSVTSYRSELSEKDHDNKRLRATIADKQSILEGYLVQITRMKDEDSTTRFSSGHEYESLKLKCDEVCRERDSLQREVARLTAKRQTDVSIQLESQTEGYRRQLRDKDDTIDRLRTESTTLYAENDVLKRERTISTVSQYDRQDYESLKRRYDGLFSERESMKKEIEMFKARPTTFSVDVESYRQEIREKEITIDRMRSEIITLQAQVEALKRESANFSSSTQYTMRVNSSSVQLDSNEEFYRQEIKDRDSVIDRLRSDTMTLQAEVDGLKRETRSLYTRVDYEALQMKYDEILKDRDTLRGELIDAKSRNERDVSIHVESRVESYQHDIRDKEILIDRLRAENMAVQNELEVLKRDVSGRVSVTEGYLGEIERLRQEVITLKTGYTDYDSLKRTYEDIVKERDFVRNQLLEVRSQSEHEISTHIDSYSEAFRQDIREKEVAIDRLRSENTTLRAELEGVKREMSSFYNRTEYESLKLQYDEVWKERDSLREELIDVKSRGERDLLIQVETKTQYFQKEIREKEVECGKLRSEIMTFQMNVDGFRRDLENKQVLIEGYQSEIERLKSEITTYRSTTVATTEYESLRRVYDEILKERDALRMEFMEFKSNSQREVSIQIENQIRIYREEVREKEMECAKLRSEGMSFQMNLDGFRRDLESKQVLIEGYQSEIERMKSEITTLRSTTVASTEYESLRRVYDEILKERDALRMEFMEFKSNSQHEVSIQIENQIRIYREEVREKEIECAKLRSEGMSFQLNLDGFRRDLENKQVLIDGYQSDIERLKAEIVTFRSTTVASTEYESLRRVYDEILKERDALRTEFMEFKSSSQREISIQIENQVRIYREEVREKEMECAKLRSEGLSFQMNVDGFRRDLENKQVLIEGYQSDIERLKAEIVTFRSTTVASTEYESLRRMYDEILKERDALRMEFMEFKSNSQREVAGQIENQIRIYREEVREKDVTINTLRSDFIKFQAENETLKREMESKQYMMEGYVSEIDRLKSEIVIINKSITEFESLKRSYDDVCRERDYAQRQLMEFKSRSEHETSVLIEYQTDGFRQEIKEKDLAIERLRSQSKMLMEEVEGLKRERSSFYSKSEYDSLKLQYEEIWKERDALRGQMAEFKSKSDREVLVQVESRVETYRTEIREKETVITRLQSDNHKYLAELEGLKRQLGNQEGYLIEIDRLKKEVTTLRFPDIRGSSEYVSLQRSFEETCKERDVLRGQVMEIKMKSEQTNENQVRVYREEIREKEVVIERLRSEVMTLKAEIEQLKRQVTTTQQMSHVEIERIRKESTVVNPAIIRSSAEFVSLQRSYDDICKERDALRLQIVEIRSKSEREVTIQIDNQVQAYREEVKEREMALDRLRSETVTLRAEIESLKRDLASKGSHSDGYVIEIDRLKREITTSRSSFESMKLKYDEVSKEKDRLTSINYSLEHDLRVAKETPVHDVKTEQELYNLRTKFAKLQEEYNALVLAMSKMEEEVVMKVNSGIADKQDYIYKLEKDIRELKSENEYYEKTVDEKNAAIGEMRLKITELQRRVESLKKEIFVADEAYEKAEMRLKEVLKSEYKPVTTYEIRRYRKSTVGKDLSEVPSQADYSSVSSSTFAASKTTSDADALHFSATSTPLKHKTSVVEFERKGGEYESGSTAADSTITSVPLDSDLARAEGAYQSRQSTTTTVTSTLTDEGSSAVGGAGSSKETVYRSSKYSVPSRYSSTTVYRNPYTTSTSRPAASGSYAMRKYSSQRMYTGTRKFV